jgi:hypothetical protein
VVMEEEISSRCRNFLLSARLRFLILCNNMRLTPQASPQIRENAQTGAMPFLMLLGFCIRSPDPTFNYLICMQGNVSKNWKERWYVRLVGMIHSWFLINHCCRFVLSPSSLSYWTDESCSVRAARRRCEWVVELKLFDLLARYNAV